jgi:multisite-specific tRNA:(cytosine-C5)-methyltransferase
VTPSDWDTFVEVLITPLPAAFRINSSSQFCEDIKSQLENDFMNSFKVETTYGDEVEAIRPLPWYPNNLAWHSNFSRMQQRKNQTLERFHEFLKLENEIGNITRQEAVSMVPPLFSLMYIGIISYLIICVLHQVQKHSSCWMLIPINKLNQDHYLMKWL